MTNESTLMRDFRAHYHCQIVFTHPVPKEEMAKVAIPLILLIQLHMNTGDIGEIVSQLHQVISPGIVNAQLL